MITKTRSGVFETNSSSTHSICIAKNATLTIPKELEFYSGEYGWGYDTLGSIEEKASYLYTGLKYLDMDDELESIIKTLESKGIDVDCETDLFNGYVDHGDELRELLTDLSSDEDLLMNYLFSDLSFILTGNDNGDGIPDINVSYDHVTYYKGN